MNCLSWAMPREMRERTVPSWAGLASALSLHSPVSALGQSGFFLIQLLGTETLKMNHKTIIGLFLAAACVCVTGCSTVPPYPPGSASPEPNPIAGWVACRTQDLGKLDKAI